MVSTNARMWRVVGGLFLLCALGAKHVTPNFEVEAPTVAMAEKVALTAERCREELAIEWLGQKLPNWSARCQVRVKVGQMGAGGATTFAFGSGHVFGWDMNVQGSLERILGSVIPHEVSHTIFASHFRRPLPRWADEGAATLAEEDGERRRQQKLAEEVMPTKRRIALRELLQITEYPKNMQHVLTLYAEGYSLANYLVQQGGKPRFLAFMQDAHQRGWDEAIHQHYDESNIEALEKKWNHWILSGSPSLERPDGTLLAQADRRERSPASSNRASPVRQSSAAREVVTATDSVAVVRSQTPESERKSANGVDATSVGHSIASRGEGLSAPAPRRTGRSTPTTNDPVVVAVAAETASAVALANNEGPSAIEPRRSREAFLTRPELHRSLDQDAASVEPNASRSDDRSRSEAAHPSPFTPVVSAAFGESRTDSVGQERATLEPDSSMSGLNSDKGSRSAAQARSTPQGTTVSPANDRKSTLRFKPFPGS
jgi:hypothetical protein